MKQILGVCSKKYKIHLFHHVMHKIGLVFVENSLYGVFVEEISVIVK